MGYNEIKRRISKIKWKNYCEEFSAYGDLAVILFRTRHQNTLEYKDCEIYHEDINACDEYLLILEYYGQFFK